jgi:4'-phosphopantetheinyl transferase
VLIDTDVNVSWGMTLDGPDLYAAAQLLDESEQRRAAAIRNDHTQRRFVSAHAMLRILVAKQIDWEPAQLTFGVRSQYGKPELVYPPIRVHFNIATAGDRVVCAVTETGPVGVDVESHEVIAEADRAGGVEQVLLTPAERAVLHEFPDRASALTRWWVRKEAMLKASGEGLAIEPPTLEMSAPDETPQLLSWQGRPVPPVWISDLDVGPGYEAAVVVLT